MTTPLQRAQRVEEMVAAVNWGWSATEKEIVLALAADVVALTQQVKDLDLCCDVRGREIEHLKARCGGLLMLLRDAFPMFSHVPLLADRAAALGLVERKEQDDAEG